MRDAQRLTTYLLRKVEGEFYDDDEFYKKVIANIEKCYSVCPINIQNSPCFLIATEKAGGCFLFNLEGKMLETIWNDPGGVMSLVPLPRQKGRIPLHTGILFPQRFQECPNCISKPWNERMGNSDSG